MTFDRETIDANRKTYYRCIESIGDNEDNSIKDYIRKLTEIQEQYGDTLEINHNENGIEIWGDCAETDSMVIRRLKFDAAAERSERDMLNRLLKKYPQ